MDAVGSNQRAGSGKRLQAFGVLRCLLTSNLSGRKSLPKKGSLKSVQGQTAVVISFFKESKHWYSPWPFEEDRLEVCYELIILEAVTDHT
jgi:hypothetical protein